MKHRIKKDQSHRIPIKMAKFNKEELKIKDKGTSNNSKRNSDII